MIRGLWEAILTKTHAAEMVRVVYVDRPEALRDLMMLECRPLLKFCFFYWRNDCHNLRFYLTAVRNPKV